MAIVEIIAISPELRGKPGLGTSSPMVDAILSHYHAASLETRYRGRYWYPDALAMAREWARYYGVTERRVVGIIAVLSPRQSWQANLRAADDMLATGCAPCLGANERKAAAIRAGARPLSVLGGDKVRAFYRAILGDTESVAVDVWAARAAGALAPDTNRQYARLVNAYRTAARQTRESPRDLQAIVWTQVRGKAD